MKTELKYFRSYIKHLWCKLWGIKTFTLYQLVKTIKIYPPEPWYIYTTKEGARQIEKAARKYVKSFKTEDFATK